MTHPNVLSETPISMVEIKAELERIKKRDGELNFRAGRAEEYLAQFVSQKPKVAEELSKKILELNIPRLKPEHVAKLVDILPITQDEVKMLLQGYTITVSKENMKRVADVVKDYKK